MSAVPQYLENVISPQQRQYLEGAARDIGLVVVGQAPGHEVVLPFPVEPELASEVASLRLRLHDVIADQLGHATLLTELHTSTTIEPYEISRSALLRAGAPFHPTARQTVNSARVKRLPVTNKEGAFVVSDVEFANYLAHPNGKPYTSKIAIVSVERLN